MRIMIFMEGTTFYTKHSEIVEQLKSNVLIEDDCKSIGGLKECCITNVKAEIKEDIQSIIITEFTGIYSLNIN